MVTQSCGKHLICVHFGTLCEQNCAFYLFALTALYICKFCFIFKVFSQPIQQPWSDNSYKFASFSKKKSIFFCELATIKSHKYASKFPQFFHFHPNKLAPVIPDKFATFFHKFSHLFSQTCHFKTLENFPLSLSNLQPLSYKRAKLKLHKFAAFHHKFDRIFTNLLLNFSQICFSSSADLALAPTNNIFSPQNVPTFVYLHLPQTCHF